MAFFLNAPKQNAMPPCNLLILHSIGACGSFIDCSDDHFITYKNSKGICSTSHEIKVYTHRINFQTIRSLPCLVNHPLEIDLPKQLLQPYPVLPIGAGHTGLHQFE